MKKKIFVDETERANFILQMSSKCDTCHSRQQHVNEKSIKKIFKNM